MFRTGILIVLSVIWFLPASAEAQCKFNEQIELQASDGQNGDGFGFSVAAEGDVILSSTINDTVDCGGMNCQPGTVYIFRHDGTDWIEEQKLQGENDGDWFGHAMAIHGDVAVIGAPWLDGNNGTIQNSGAVYIYRYDGSTWNQEARILAPNPMNNSDFGWKVDIEGDTVIISEPSYFGGFHPVGLGSVYVYERQGGDWVQVQRLRAPDRTPLINFGQSVSLDDDNILIGAPFDDDNGVNSGSVYHFVNPEPEDRVNSGNGPQMKTPTNVMILNGPWEFVTEIYPSDPANSDEFGSAVSLDGSRALIGSPRDDDQCGSPPTCGTGSAYLFDYDGIEWTESHKFLASNESSFADYGSTLILENDIALIGAAGASPRTTSYVYREINGQWLEQQINTRSSNGLRGGFIDEFLALADRTVVMGTHTAGFPNAGKGYVPLFDIPDIALTIFPPLAGPNLTVTIDSCGGAPGNPLVLFLTKINDTPMFLNIYPMTFYDAWGQWTLSFNLGPNIPVPNTMEFTMLSVDQYGSLIFSNVAVLEVQ